MVHRVYIILRRFNDNECNDIVRQPTHLVLEISHRIYSPDTLNIVSSVISGIFFV